MGCDRVRWCEQVREEALGEVGQNGESSSGLCKGQWAGLPGQGSPRTPWADNSALLCSWMDRKTKTETQGWEGLAQRATDHLLLICHQVLFLVRLCGFANSTVPKADPGTLAWVQELRVSVAAVGSPTSLKSKDTVCFSSPWKLVSWKSTQEQCRSFRTLATDWWVLMAKK